VIGILNTPNVETAICHSSAGFSQKVQPEGWNPETSPSTDLLDSGLRQNDNAISVNAAANPFEQKYRLCYIYYATEDTGGIA